MNLSLGEFQALVAKAFRGAGYPWGLTEDACYAARRLAEFGFPAGEMVVRLLRAVDGVAISSLMPDDEWQSTGGLLCPVCLGVSIADLGGAVALSTGPVLEPAFLAPLLARTLDDDAGEGYAVHWDGGGCELVSDTIRVAGDHPDRTVRVSIERRPVETTAATRATRVELVAETFDALAALAHRTYAPATEASRLAGAGAGITDND